MERINELAYNPTVSYQKSTDIMVQLAVLRKAFGVKNDESSKEIVDYERSPIMTPDELTEEFFRYNYGPYQAAKERKSYEEEEYEQRVISFIEAVSFFDKKLADKFSIVMLEKDRKEQCMTPQQFKDKIRNIANEKHIHPQIAQRYFMMEKFLEKISESTYKDDFVLKGGFLIGSKYGIDKRSTVDIDTTFRNSKLTEERIRNVFDELTQDPTKEGISFTLLGLKETREADFYPGFQAKFIAYLDNAKIPFKLDITTGDAIYPKATTYSHKLMLEDKDIQIPAYPTEQIIAEKLHTTFAFGEDNSRMKDFYDLHVIPKLEELDDKKLFKSVKATFKHRESIYSLKELYEKEMPVIANNKLLDDRWRNFQRDNKYAENISFEEVVSSLDLLMEKMVQEEGKEREQVKEKSKKLELSEALEQENQFHY